ncbi:hypothetical protein RYZ27_05725 [Hyphomonas sp. FCG-A18]|uniref:hypothetical protein n=1 Tax=Hyphomonas sp. FCG-A18 TaxID=3080019 RepID=UPI002B2B2C0A|nr:hypothetical protein RYZ27_05725 [Hyphomonas sp. FCG-A18]
MPIIRLDLEQLQQSGAIDADLAAKLETLALPSKSGTAWISAILIFGALGVAAGVLALEPSATVGLILALVALSIALFLKFFQKDESWHLLGSAFAVMGTIGLSAWVALEAGETAGLIWPPLVIFAIMTAGALTFRSSFLAAMAVLALGAVLGTGTFYWHASYALIVREPTITILVFGLLTLALYALRPRLKEVFSSMATVAARTSLFLVQFGFWVGSLWGDHIGEHWAAGEGWRARMDWRDQALEIPEAVFSIGWAAFLIALFVKAPRGSFLSVSAFVFFAIHLYTQFFEVFADRAEALILGGFLAIGVAIAAARIMKLGPQKSV